MAGDKTQRRAAIALLAAYHEARLADLIEHVRDGLARYDAGEIDAFELDAVMHENDGFVWPRCDGLNWPHLRPIAG